MIRRPLVLLLGLTTSSTAAAEGVSGHIQFMGGVGSGQICIEDECGSRHIGRAISVDFGVVLLDRFSVSPGTTSNRHSNDDFHGQNWIDTGDSYITSTPLLKVGVYVLPGLIVQAGAGLGYDFFMVQKSSRQEERGGLALGGDVSFEHWTQDNLAVGVRAQGLMLNDYPGGANHVGLGLYLHYL